MEAHNITVNAISESVQSFYEQKIPFRIYHGTTNSTRQYKVNRNRMVDTSALNKVLVIDTINKICLVEPNVAMDQLVDEVMKYGLVPPVVMEFPGITVGGGFAGTAGESSGFKYGFFDRIVNWIEFILPTGEVVNASAEHNPDLFHGAAGTFGTLGVATLFEIQLIEATKYVELTYHTTGSIKEALSTMNVATKDDTNNYVDGILFAKDRGVIVTGRFTNDICSSNKVQRFSRRHDPLFYLHVDRAAKGKRSSIKEMVPLSDYLFRYDRGAFWTVKYAFRYFLLPYNRITRWVAGSFLHTRTMYHALHASGHASKYIVQDLLLPQSTAEGFIDYVDDKFGFWPLWLCPLKPGEEISMRPRLDGATYEDGKEATFVNVGVWGPGPTNYTKFVEANRQLEEKVRDYGGIKWLYAQAFYTEEEFWRIYDRQWYDALRDRYHASHLPTVYDKVKVDLSGADDAETTWSERLRQRLWVIWPVSGLYGVFKTLYEREYLLAKR